MAPVTRRTAVGSAGVLWLPAVSRRRPRAARGAIVAACATRRSPTIARRRRSRDARAPITMRAPRTPAATTPARPTPARPKRGATAGRRSQSASDAAGRGRRGRGARPFATPDAPDDTDDLPSTPRRGAGRAARRPEISRRRERRCAHGHLRRIGVRRLRVEEECETGCAAATPLHAYECSDETKSSARWLGATPWRGRRFGVRRGPALSDGPPPTTRVSAARLQT